MTDKELRKLKRMDLLRLLIAQDREITSLKEQIRQMKKKLASREIMIREAGSIAEAAIRLNGVLEAAQNAADQYLLNVQKLYMEEEQQL